MPLWGNLDQANNAPKNVVAAATQGQKVTGISSYGNTTPSAIINKAVIGTFAVDTTEMNNANTSVISLQILNGGTGYNSLTSNALVFTPASGGAGVAGTYANNANGTITSVTLTTYGSGYNMPPTVVANSAGTGAVIVARIAEATKGKISHTGWVLRKEGTGGRAGRVSYETLVATGTIASDNPTFNTILPQT